MRIRLLQVGILALGLALVAAKPALAQSTRAQQLKLAVSTATPHNTPLWVARDKGIFDKYGVDVQLIFVMGGALVSQMLAAGQAVTLHFAHRTLEVRILELPTRPISKRAAREMYEVLREEQAPLVVAAVDYLLPIFRQASAYPHLLQRGIEGNPDRLSEKELHDRAWTLVEPSFQAARTKSMVGRMCSKYFGSTKF